VTDPPAIAQIGFWVAKTWRQRRFRAFLFFLFPFFLSTVRSSCSAGGILEQSYACATRMGCFHLLGTRAAAWSGIQRTRWTGAGPGSGPRAWVRLGAHVGEGCAHSPGSVFFIGEREDRMRKGLLEKAMRLPASPWSDDIRLSPKHVCDPSRDEKRRPVTSTNLDLDRPRKLRRDPK
jgi:hypothetical protein